MGRIKEKTKSRILWIWWKSSLFKKDSASCCYNVLWEEGNVTTVDNVIWGWSHYLSPTNICSNSYTGPHFCGIIHTQNAHPNKQHLCNAHFATKEFQCCMHSFTILNQPPVHDTKSSARFPPNIKSLNSNVSSNLSIITKSVHLNWVEMNSIWFQAIPGPMCLGLRTGLLCPMFYYQIREALSL
jgi:hypothetical protein